MVRFVVYHCIVIVIYVWVLTPYGMSALINMFCIVLWLINCKPFGRSYRVSSCCFINSIAVITGQCILITYNETIYTQKKGKFELIGFFNATFNNISVISWRSVLFVEETGVPGGNHRPVVPVASHWQAWSHNVVSSTSHHEWGSNSQI